MKYLFLALPLFAVFITNSLFAQDITDDWIVNTIDSTIKVTLPGKVEMKQVVERMYMGWTKKDDAVFIVQKIDVYDDVKRDTSDLSAQYDRIVKGFLRQSQATLINQRNIKNGIYTGRYLQGKMMFNDVLCFLSHRYLN